jgi:hypothetical protein
VTYVLDWAVTVVQYGSSFYAFWLVWRVLLPDLPGPPDPSDRVAPYVGYLTDPFVVPVARRCMSRRDWSRWSPSRRSRHCSP